MALHSVGVSAYVDDAVFGKSIAEVDNTVLFGPPLDPTQANSGARISTNLRDL